ncbi:MAG: anthranilate synthase component I, partial [Pseudomonadota bacterium]
MKYTTRGGVTVTKETHAADLANANSALVARLDSRMGAFLASNYEYPGRYNRWEFGFVGPPVMIAARGRDMRIAALNARGRVLLSCIDVALESCVEVAAKDRKTDEITLSVKSPDRVFDEEERSRMPSVFSVLRAISHAFQSDEDDRLGLYGAMGYDLAFQFEPIDFQLERPDDQRDLVMFIPDRILMVDHYGQQATEVHYEFAYAGQSTEGLPCEGEDSPYRFGP